MNTLCDENFASASDVAIVCNWIREHHGYDFQDYQPRPLQRSLASILRKRGLQDGKSLVAALEKNAAAFPNVLAEMTVTTSTMFRNPKVFKALVRDVFPHLKTYSTFKVWHAGCAKGEEAYSLAILLKEHDLLQRARIYATDINPVALETAREGIYPARRLQEFSENYQEATGKSNLSEHFEMKYNLCKFSEDLRSRILFSKHDLVSDTSFGEMHLIICRNVLIYFGASLQRRSLDLFKESLAPGGFLCLGLSEKILTDKKVDGVEPFARSEMIFRTIDRVQETREYKT